MSNIHNLPKWAQRDIAWLNQQINERDALIARLRTVVGPDCEEGIIIDPHSQHPIYFHPDNTIRFWIEPGKLSIDVDMRPRNSKMQTGGLNVNACGSLISIMPEASNAVHISGVL